MRKSRRQRICKAKRAKRRDETEKCNRGVWGVSILAKVLEECRDLEKLGLLSPGKKES